MYGVVINDSLGLTKDQLMSMLREKGVDTRAFFCPMSLQPLFKGSDSRFPDISGDYPVSVDLWDHGTLSAFRATSDETANRNRSRKSEGM